jgi:hypothetical protein
MKKNNKSKDMIDDGPNNKYATTSASINSQENSFNVYVTFAFTLRNILLSFVSQELSPYMKKKCFLT